MADCKALIDKLLDPDIDAFVEKVVAFKADGVPPARAQIAAVDALIQEAWDDRAILIAQIQEEHPGLIDEVGTSLADAPITPVQDSFPGFDAPRGGQGTKVPGFGAPPPTAAPVERRAPPVLTGPPLSDASKKADNVERERVASITQVPIDRAERKLTKAERKRRGREKAGAAPVVPTPTEETTPATTEAPTDVLSQEEREEALQSERDRAEVFPKPPGDHVGAILLSDDLANVVTDYLAQVRALMVARGDETLAKYEAILATANITPPRGLFKQLAELMDDAQFSFLGQDPGATPDMRAAQDIFSNEAIELMSAAPKIADAIVETLKGEPGLAALVGVPKDADKGGRKKRSAAEVLKKKQPKRAKKTGKGTAAIKAAAKPRKAKEEAKPVAAKEDKKESKPAVARKPKQVKREREQPAAVAQVYIWTKEPGETSFSFHMSFPKVDENTGTSFNTEWQAEIEGLQDAGIKTKLAGPPTTPTPTPTPTTSTPATPTPTAVEEVSLTASQSEHLALAEEFKDQEVFEILDTKGGARTNLQILDIFVALATTGAATNGETFRTGAQGLIEMAFFPAGGITASHKRAAEYVAGAKGSLLYGSPENAAITKEVFYDIIINLPEQRYTSKKTGKLNAWAAYALAKGMVARIHQNAAFPPIAPTPEIEAAIGLIKNIKVAQVSRAETKAAKQSAEGADKLSQILTEIDAQMAAAQRGPHPIDDRRRETLDNRVAEVFKNFKPDLTKTHAGFTLKAWFRGNKLKWEKAEVVDRWQISTPENAQASTSENLKTADKPPNRSGSSSNLEGGPITKPMGLGAVKLSIRSFAAKLNKRVRPRIMVYKNVAEFKKKKPDLFEEARTSRQDKAPIPDDAAGYAFGNTVLIFSDNIKNKQHLIFVLAHETMGHFGLAAIMPDANRIRLMNEIYNTDADIRGEADRRMEAFGVDQQEATEDALADMAGDIESSTIMRVWDAIKRFLARIGARPRDEMARYFVYQSRRYARTGTTGDVSAQAIYDNMIALENRYVTGRASEAYLFGRATAQNSVVNGRSAVSGGLNSLLSAITRKHTLEEVEGRTIGAINMLKNGLELIQTLDQKAMRSEGLRMLFDVFRLQTEHVRELQTQLNEITEFATRGRWFWLANPKDANDTRGGVKGLDAEEKHHMDRLLELRAVVMSQTADERAISKTDTFIVYDEDGNPSIDMSKGGGVEKLKDIGNVSRKQFKDGLPLQVVSAKTGQPMWKDDAKTIPVTEDRKIDFDITDRVWKGFEQQVEAIDMIALQVHLDKILGMLETKDVALKEMQFDNPTLKKDDLDVLAEIAKVYAARHNASAKLEGQGLKWDQKDIDNAELMLRELIRAFHEPLKVKDWVEGNLTLREDGELEASEKFRKDKDLQGIIAKLAQLHSRGIKEKQANNIKRTIANLNTLNTQVTNSEFYAKRTLMSGYVPFKRRGKLQVRVQAFDEHDNPIKLDETVEAMLFFTRTDDTVEANRMVKELDAIFAGRKTNVLTRDHGVQEVTFAARSSFALKTPPLGGSVSYDEMAQTLVRLGINITPKERQTLVEMTARQHSSARSNLNKSGNPGWDPDITRGIAEHLETQTHIAGKNRFKHRTADIMADRRKVLWHGDKKRLNDLQDAYLLARNQGNEPLRVETYKAMAQYQHMYLNSSSEPGIVLIKEDGTKHKKDGLKRGNIYKDDGLALVEYYNSTGNIADATGEEKFGKFAPFFMSGTAALQLGGALAPALINLSSLASHAIPYLATLNKKTGYGGGHGMGAASRAIGKAGKNLSLLKGGVFLDETGSANEIRKIIKKGRLKEFGLTEDEIQFLLDMTEKGVLTPNMFNALIGTSRTGKQDIAGRVVEKWMLLFSKTEQYNRRVTALASYRLEKARMIATGVDAKLFDDPTSEASQTVRDRSVLAVNASQGNYSQFNRPPIARGNIFQYLFMYKQFVLITVQLMRNLGTWERTAFLAFLIFASGLKGLPFAEDFLDIADTLAQKFGINTVGLEVEIAKLSNAIIPGSAPILLRGILDYSLGATFSTRLGHGDLIPGTGMFMAGADTGREAMGLLGPVASAVTGALATGALAVQYIAELVGLRPDVTTLTDIAREGFGSSAVKSWTDGLVFWADGNITNQRGQVISKGAGIHQVLWRMMGFYPGSATTHNDVVRLGRRTTEHAKEIKTSFIDAYIKGDREERREIKRDVREWNKDAKGTPFFITNFSQSAQKAVTSARQTTSGRFVRAAPKQVRRTLLDKLLPIYGFTTKGVPVDYD